MSFILWQVSLDYSYSPNLDYSSIFLTFSPSPVAFSLSPLSAASDGLKNLMKSSNVLGIIRVIIFIRIQQFSQDKVISISNISTCRQNSRPLCCPP